jgi:hypothetical protein
VVNPSTTTLAFKWPSPLTLTSCFDRSHGRRGVRVPPCSFGGRQAQTAVHLRKNGVGFSRMVHRLVALAFIENPENKPEVNHKEAPKTNNAANNLEWATRAENDEHKKVHGWTTPGTKNQADYAQANADFDDEIDGIAKKLHAARSQRSGPEVFSFPRCSERTSAQQCGRARRRFPSPCCWFPSSNNPRRRGRVIPNGRDPCI